MPKITITLEDTGELGNVDFDMVFGDSEKDAFSYATVCALGLRELFRSTAAMEAGLVVMEAINEDRDPQEALNERFNGPFGEIAEENDNNTNTRRANKAP